jgi:hypothetical protein
MAKEGKEILSVDFDGTLSDYKKWHGADIINDPPIPGAMAFLKEATDHFRVAIFSSRSNLPGGIAAMQGWLAKHNRQPDGSYPDWLLLLEWPVDKPPAQVSLDDRAIPFNGIYPSMETLRNFKPWNKR